MLSSILPIPLSLLAVAPAALGRITNITFPATATAGDMISAQVTNQNYIQNWDDYGIAFGIARPQYACAECIGQRIYYFNNLCVPILCQGWAVRLRRVAVMMILMSSNASTTGNDYGSIIPITHDDTYPINMTVPNSFESGEYVLVAAVPYTVGVSSTLTHLERGILY